MKELKDKIEIPNDVDIDISILDIKLKGPKGETQKKVYHPSVKIEKKENFIILTVDKSTKKEKRILNTLKAHIKNLIKGVMNGFEYELKICSGHFPMNVSVEKNNLIIKNFFGEKIPRKARILPGVNVKVSGDKVTVSGCNKDDVGQTCSNIEQSARRTSFDRRIFQDGVWLTKKVKKV